MHKNLSRIIVVAAIVLSSFLTGCNPEPKEKTTQTPTVMISSTEDAQSLNIGQGSANPTTQTTMEDSTPTVSDSTPTVAATSEPSSAVDWKIIVNDTKSQDIQGMAINYNLILMVENPHGTSSNAAGTYTGSAVLRQNMDASQLNNSALSFAGGFDVVMVGESVSIDLKTYDFDTYSEMGSQFDYQVLAPLVKYAYATVTQVQMNGSGTLNPFVQAIGGESAGTNESASGSGGVTFDITIYPDGKVSIASPTIPVIFKGVLVRSGDSADELKDQALQKMKEIQEESASQ